MATTQTVLVTGATGFLGTQIIRALLNQSGMRVIAACRNRERLAGDIQCEVREGDLREADYRQQLVQGIDVLCHAGTWASLWGHRQQEEQNFYRPTLDLIAQARLAGVQRFIMSSTVAVAPGLRRDQSNRMRKTGYWPHLDRLIDIEQQMQAEAGQGMQMISLRLGHFIGAGNRLGLIPALAPRLKTRLVPWLAGGHGRLPLISATDLGSAFLATALAQGLNDYEAIDIIGRDSPSMRELISTIHQLKGLPRPKFSVPYSMGYVFGWAMEMLFPILPGKAPFLTRAIVHLAEDRLCDTRQARDKLGFSAAIDWRVALRESLNELAQDNYPWPALSQA